MGDFPLLFKWFICKYNLLRPVVGTRAFILFAFPTFFFHKCDHKRLETQKGRAPLCWQRSPVLGSLLWPECPTLVLFFVFVFLTFLSGIVFSSLCLLVGLCLQF